MKGACHCGRVTIQVPGPPDQLTVCNCTQCWQRGALWAYFPASEVRVEGELSGYRREDIDVYLTTNFCPNCGVTTSWVPARPEMADRMGVNMRLFDPTVLRGIEVVHPNGRSDDAQSGSSYRAPFAFDDAGLTA